MKSKIPSYNQSISHHPSTNNSSTNSTTRARNSNGKYSSVVLNSTKTKTKESDKDICNNNEEDVSGDSDYFGSADRSVHSDSVNNNSINDAILEELDHLRVDDNEESCHVAEHYCCEDNDEVEDGEGINEDTDESTESGSENRTNLIVNYLPQNMTQEEMKALFSGIGDVESCKLIRDKTTGQSLSYGFVNYQDPKDASAAILRYNGLRLQNKVIKVSLARPSSETIKGANLYICGLPKAMSQIELEQLFSQYGTIITCRILVDNVTGNSKGVAFIRFDQRHEAETAIKNLNGHTPPNGTEPMTVKLANTPFNINNNTTNLQTSVNHNPNSEYITQIPGNTSSIPSSNSVGNRCMVPNTRSMSSNGSDIIPRLDVVLPNNGHHTPGVMGPEYGQSLSNHQMQFPTGPMICPPTMHSLATFPMSYAGIQHPCLQPMGGPPGPTPVPQNSLVPVNGNHPSSQYMPIDPMTIPAHLLDSNLCYLFVYNLSPDAKEGALWHTFGPYGAVHSVSLARDSVTGKCRGFGFVTMPNYHEAILAAQHLNGNSLDNRMLQIILNPGLKLSAISQYVLPTMAP